MTADPISSGRGAVHVAHGPSDQARDLLHIALGHALCRDRRRADPNARGRHRRLRVVGNGVLVERDSGRVAARLRLLARDADAAQVDEREVGVGAARDGAHALGGKSVGERLRVRDDLAGVRLVLGLLRLAQGDGLGGNGMHQRAALAEGEHGLVDLLGELLGAHDHAAARTAQDLVS